MSADLCINITDDNMMESNETFSLKINTTTSDAEVILMEPNTTTVTIEDDECTLEYKNVNCLQVYIHSLFSH